MLSIEPVIAGSTSRVLPLLTPCVSLYESEDDRAGFLGGAEIVIDVIRLVVGAMLIALTRLVILVQIDDKLGRGRKVGCFIVAIRDGFLAESIIGSCTPVMTVGLSDKSPEFCDGIAFFVGSETFANHRSCLDSASAPGARPKRIQRIRGEPTAIINLGR
jgi:hypothetical protein